MELGRNLTTKNIILGLIFLIVLALLPALVSGSSYWVHVSILCILNIGMVASVRLIFIAGEISMCHAAFMAIGAYSSALLAKYLGFPFWVGLPIAGAVAGLIAFSIGYATLRAKGIYFILTTLAFSEVVRLIISNWGLLGAVNGLYDIPRPDPLFGIKFVDDTSFYYLVLIMTLVTLWICHRVEHSRYGLILRSIAQAPSITESVGINIMTYKVVTFVVACFFAGVFGSFYAHYTTVIHPDMFSLWHSIMYIIYFQIGGVASLWGAVVGGGGLTVAAEFIRITKHLETVTFAVLLIVIILFLPDGLIGLPARLHLPKLWLKIRHRSR
jgi:branched-chain amino acid transport system permease protein